MGFDYTYHLVNATVANQAKTSPDDLLGRTMMEAFPGIEQTEMFASLRRCLEQRERLRLENEFTFPDGSVGWFDLQFIPVPEGACILSVDITEQKRAQDALRRTEEQLGHAQKMEAIGRLAGGVAHDFNNLLSVILSYGELVLATQVGNAAVTEDVDEIIRAARRAAELTSQLLSFSRQQVTAPRILDLNECVRSTERMLRRVLGEDIELRTVMAKDLDPVRADPGQLEQILLNLAVNSRDAMPTGGKLSIETANVDLDEAYASAHLGTTPGPHVMLAVSDTGIGMDRETRAKAFEPFFTTKGAGKGTGLGLSTVFGIVQQSRGSIWLYSEPGKGTTFKIYLPRGLSEATLPAEPAPPPRVQDGHGTILVLEDDEQLRRLTESLLRRHGYEVLIAATPADALTLAARHGGAIDLLLTDVVMPGMNGPEVALRMRELRPDTRVLFMSGYTGDAVVHHGVLDAGAHFVPKPLTPGSLAHAVHRALGGES